MRAIVLLAALLLAGCPARAPDPRAAPAPEPECSTAPALSPVAMRRGAVETFETAWIELGRLCKAAAAQFVEEGQYDAAAARCISTLLSSRPTMNRLHAAVESTSATDCDVAEEGEAVATLARTVVSLGIVDVPSSVSASRAWAEYYARACPSR